MLLQEIRLCSEIGPRFFSIAIATTCFAVPHAAHLPTFLSDGAEFLLKFNVVAGTLYAVRQAGDRGLKVHQLGAQVGVR